MELHGAVAVVTGASSGIGWSTAWALAGRGATVVVSARRSDRLELLAREIERRGGRALAVTCDVSSRSQVEALRASVDRAYGRCDVLVNNAGVPGGGPFLDVSADQIDRVVGTNYLGVLYCTRAFLPGMVESGRGHVVNVASLAGRFSIPGSSLYASTKHAVVAFSESLHYEVGSRGVAVTVVNPGLVDTERFPHTRARGPLRVMRPERIARTVVDVLERDRGPEVFVPRWIGSAQAVRLLVPPLYRFALRRVARSRSRATPAGDTEEA